MIDGGVIETWTNPHPYSWKRPTRPWLDATRPWFDGRSSLIKGAILAGTHPACIEVGEALGLNPSEWLSISTREFKAPKGCGFGRVLVDAATVGDVSREIRDALNMCALPHRMQWHWLDRDVL